ncbi:hypothetical protein [Embleya sp. NPDC001921]
MQNADIDALKLVGLTITDGTYHFLGETNDPSDKIREYLAPGSGEFEATSATGTSRANVAGHSDLTFDTTWNLAYFSDGGQCLEIARKDGKVFGSFWDSTRKEYRSFFWSAPGQALFAARMDSATVDKYGAPTDGSRYLVDPVWFSIGTPSSTPFSDFVVGEDEKVLFGLQDTGPTSSLVWGDLHPGSGHGDAGVLSVGGVDFGVARRLLLVTTSRDHYVVGTPDGVHGPVKRFDVDQFVSAADITVPEGWEFQGRPVVVPAQPTQRVCALVRKGRTWGIVVADVEEFVENRAAVITLPDAYVVAPLAVHPRTGAVYAICLSASSPGKTLLQVVQADASNPKASPTPVATWYSSLDLYSDNPEHLWCYSWG